MGTHPAARTLSAILCSLAGLLAACSSSGDKSASSAKAQPAAPVATPTATPAADDHSEHALHNVHRIGSKLISGGVPDGDAAFDELEAMGVKTIISVDGALPDLDRAKAHGMRYVHIPITYSEANKDQQLAIARAVRDLPGPIYLHCHHGKHRGPAAAASAAILLGEITPEQGVAWMKNAGTAPTYKGLYACVANAAVASAAALDAAPSDFPSVHKPQGMVAAMVDIEHINNLMNDVRAAGWKVPEDSPDLVPAAEAGRLVDNLRVCGETPESKALGPDYASKLANAIKIASGFEEALVRNAPKEDLESAWKLVTASCKDCHVAYRDNKR